MTIAQVERMVSEFVIERSRVHFINRTMKTTKKTKNQSSTSTSTKTIKTSPIKRNGPRPNRICLEYIQPGAKHVQVAGSFNGWRPESTPLQRTDGGKWIGDLRVEPGRYEYLFVVDGQWIPDPNAKESVQN